MKYLWLFSQGRNGKTLRLVTFFSRQGKAAITQPEIHRQYVELPSLSTVGGGRLLALSFQFLDELANRLLLLLEELVLAFGHLRQRGEARFHRLDVLRVDFRFGL